MVAGLDGLVRAWELLAPGGVVQSVGWSSGESATLPPYANAGDTTLTAFRMGTGVGTGPATLLGLVADGRLSVEVSRRGAARPQGRRQGGARRGLSRACRRTEARGSGP
ncbi:hypothetical protein [Streptomyces roseirectus]|uniref:hypothetical protein n=1 Tax=Streptomyces roseirectus TaxID=2768066 RepID=UPI001FECD08A|nr:hypothetical protein [Streptomyces roseirectus]